MKISQGHWTFLRSRVQTKVVWRFSRSKRAMELHSQQNGTAIQRNWSCFLQKYQCFESWDLEEKERQMYHSLQWRFYEYRTLVPNSSRCQSPQFLRSSCELVLPIRLNKRRKKTSRLSCGQKDFVHGGTRRSGIVGISSDSGTWKQVARKRVELQNIGKEDTAYTTMCKSLLPTSCDYYKIRPNADDGWGTVTPLCREYSSSRSYPKTKDLSAIPEGTTIGPVLEVHVVKVHDGYGTEVATQSTAKLRNTPYVVISRETERFVNEIHDHKQELRSTSRIRKK